MRMLDARLLRGWDTAAAALAACARAAGDARSRAQIAAASGLAFRVVADATVSLAGPHAYPWQQELSAAAERLGYECRVVASDEPAPGALHQSAQARALVLIADGVGAGRPTMIWGVHAPEFGIAYGLDGDRLLVSG